MKNKKAKKSVIALVCSLLICSMFLVAYLTTTPISKESCTEMTVTYESSKLIIGRFVNKQGIHLYFSDATSYYIDEYNLGYGLQEEIKTFAPGTVLSIAVDEDSGEIIELTHGDEELLTYSSYVERTEKQQQLVFYALLISLILPLISCISLIKNKKK